jgi:hypothetical protein
MIWAERHRALEQSVLIIGNKQSQNYPNTNWIAANESPERLKSEISRHDYVAWMQLTSVYGPDYITRSCPGIQICRFGRSHQGKVFTSTLTKLSLQHPAHEYKYIDHFNPYRSIVTSQVALDILKPDMPISIHRRALSIDRFNFCQLSEFSVETSTDLVQHETFV